MTYDSFLDQDRGITVSEQGSSRGSAYIENNKLIRSGSRLHVSWLNAGGGSAEPVCVRTLDLKNNRWSPLCQLGMAVDNHGGPTLINDSEGYLHTIYGPHNGPLKYRRSKNPDDTSDWCDEITFGKTCTYPSVVCDKNDTLHLVCREKKSPTASLVYYRRPRNGNWSNGKILVSSDLPTDKSYRCYRASLYLDAEETLHLGFMLFPPAAFRNALEEGVAGYMRSRDGGETWMTAAETDEIILSSGEFDRIPAVGDTLRTSNLICDTQGRPCLITVATGFQTSQQWGNKPSPSTSKGLMITKDWGEAAFWRHDGNQWQGTQLLPLLSEICPGHRASWAEPSLSLADNGRLYMALTLVDEAQIDPKAEWLGEPGSIYGHPSSVIVVFSSSDNGRNWTPLVRGISGWMPSLERHSGHNAVSKPYLLYTLGLPGFGCKPGDIETKILLRELD